LPEEEGDIECWGKKNQTFRGGEKKGKSILAGQKTPSSKGGKREKCSIP